MTAPFRFDPPSRILLGPGPSEVSPRVLGAMAHPTVGYLDPTYTALLEALQPLLRMVFATQNETILTMTGAATAAMEAALVNVLEPGDACVVCVHGYFGDRMAQIAARTGARVHVVEAPWGQCVSPKAVAEQLARVPGVKALCVVHGETSTGVEQPIAELGALARAHGALLIVDAVASLAGTDFCTDDWQVDVAYTGAQKCLSAPPGISPMTFGPRAMDVVGGRKVPVQSWYLDLLLNLQVWRQPHRYHHTGPTNLTYALYEALRMVEEEGLAHRVARTRRLAQGLWAGLEAMGLTLAVAPADRLATLTAVRIPDGVDDGKVRGYLLSRFGIEIAGGLGPLAGKIWRIGLMGTSCTYRNVAALLAALEDALGVQGHPVPRGAALAALAAFG